MSSFEKLTKRLESKGFSISFLSHSKAIMSLDFPGAWAEIVESLCEFEIPITELIGGGGGGGEAKGTQRLRHSLSSVGWKKHNFQIEKRIDSVTKESISHEIDHVKFFAEGRALALEIEWNNKDPFFDRDLENFKRLHAEGAISVGIIVTRGEDLQEGMSELVRNFVAKNDVNNLADLIPFDYEPTSKQREAIRRRMKNKRNPLTFREAFVSKFVADKYGAATTHWTKLDDRVKRGVGNPCPLILIGLPKSIVIE